MRPGKLKLEGHMKLKCVPLIVALAAGCLAAPRAPEAQPQVGKLSRVGVLLSAYRPDDQPPEAFRERLQRLGYVEGQNLHIEWRYAQGRDDRLSALAAELVRL